MLNIVLHQPEMPANVGNIIRTAAAINSKLHIIGPLSFSFDDKQLKRAGLDYFDSSNIISYDNLEGFFKVHPNPNIFYVTRYSKTNYTTMDYGRYDEVIFLMFGNESYGLPHELLASAKDKCVRIPMVASARSLNLSNAVAIVAFEVLRQQEFYNLATSEVIKGEDFL